MLSKLQYADAFNVWIHVAGHRLSTQEIEWLEKALDYVVENGPIGPSHPNTLCELMYRWQNDHPELNTRHLRATITKSCLLARLIYGGEPLRTRECPEHGGHWSGCSPDPCPHGCSYGNNITGWVKE